MTAASSSRSRSHPSRLCWCPWACRNLNGYARSPTGCMPSSPPPELKCCTTTAMPVRGSNSRTLSCWGFLTAWSSENGGWMQANSSTAAVVTRKARNSRSTMPSHSSARAWLLNGVRTAIVVAGALLSSAAFADGQRDPELKDVVQRAITQAECFTDHYDSAVWYTLMEPRLRVIVKEHDERMEILKQVYCETHRSGEARLPPGLVMAVMDIESP